VTDDALSSAEEEGVTDALLSGGGGVTDDARSSAEEAA
jgi:hypothetical protein